MSRSFRAAASGAFLLALIGAAAAQAPTAASAPMAAPAAAPAPVAAPAPAPAPAPAAAPAAGVENGKIAWYGAKFNGRRTASGERFNAAALTMAHKTLPFGTRVKVTNTKNGKSVVVRVNDRGPSTAGLVGDVSRAAAQRLRMLRSGVVDASLEVVGQAPARAKKS